MAVTITPSTQKTGASIIRIVAVPLATCSASGSNPTGQIWP